MYKYRYFLSLYDNGMVYVLKEYSFLFNIYYLKVLEC